MVVESIILVSISVAGYALNLIGVARVVACFEVSFEPPIYEHVVEYIERAQWRAMTLCMNRV